MKHIIIAVLLVLTGCATQQPLTTISGKADGVFALAPADARDVVANWCVGRGYDIRAADDFRIVCAKPVQGGKGFAINATFGGPGSSGPFAVVTFTMLGAKGGTRVIASTMVEIQRANGRIEQLDMGANGTHEMQAHLRSMGAQ